MNKYFASLLSLCILLLAGCNSAQQLYKKGEKKLQLGEYQLAIGYLEKAKTKNPNFLPGVVNSSIAASYRLSNRLRQASPFYQSAIAAGNNEDSVLFYYGYALKEQGKYQEAAKQFEKYLKSAKHLQRKSLAQKELDNLPAIEKLATEKTFYEIQNVSLLNTEASEFSPVIQNEDIVFTSSRKEGIYKANGLGFVGLYKTSLTPDSSGNLKPELFSEQIFDDKVNEGTPTFSRDGKIMIFARGNKGGRTKAGKPIDMDLYISRFKDGKWAEPEILPKPINFPETWDASPALSTDGKTLYFASNRDGGLGGIDIYSATSDGSGRFGRVTKLGAEINTPGNDLFPYVTDDGKLYFSSDGHSGLGGLDMFMATRKNGVTEVQNLGIPMNSVADDFGVVFTTPTTGYFSSNREGGKGDDDIYSFEDKTPNYKIVNYYLAGVTVTQDKAGKEQILGNTKITFREGDKTIGEVTTKEDGSFNFRVQESKNYTIIGEKPEYFTKREFFSMSGRSIPQELLVKAVTDTTFHVKVPMDKAEVNKVFVVENIYYDLDKANIRADAAEELDKLLDFLKDNPNITIELSSHTDDRATDVYNQDLSQRRAESATQYLIQNGIAADRIKAVGYGESRLLIKTAETEEEHQKNRRTEIKVLGINAK